MKAQWREEGQLTDRILITKKEAAQLLSVSLRTVDNLIARGELQVRRIGKRVLIPRRALEEFARRDHRTRPTTVVVAGDGDAR